MPRTACTILFSRSLWAAALMLASGASLANCPVARANDPAATILEAQQVLSELVAIPGRRISQRRLSEAKAIAIVPRVIKVGFIAGVRRGHGVIMIRDAEGEWSLPQFLTLTGGSIGWQAGIQGTDVVLVFRTQTSVDNLLRGKFTIGADAAAAAGPVGRNASAATDAQLRAEILSFSRSRGLFAGVSLDGTVLEINQNANAAFYGAPSTELPQRVPQSAANLRLYLTELFNAALSAAPDAVAPALAAVAAPVASVSPTRLEALQTSLYAEGAILHGILSPEWQTFLALPAKAESPAAVDRLALSSAYNRFEQVNASPEFKELASRAEFQTTFELLREYNNALNAGVAMLNLPPPPTK